MSQPSSSNPGVLSVRIVSLDYYMAHPIPDIDISYSSFHGGKVKEVPVIRIYGPTVAGQKTCLHVHGALPYLYVPLSDVAPHIQKKDDVFLHAISKAIERALSTKSSLGAKRQHVHGWVLVRAKKFYGYHASEELFLKIYLYYPNDVDRLAALLLGGDVFNRKVQPYESHIPYLLQFLVDNNLYGMGHLHTSKFKFRQPLPETMVSSSARCKIQNMQGADSFLLQGPLADLTSDATENTAVWLLSTVPNELIWPSLSLGYGNEDGHIYCVKRQSICELEGDCSVDDILNQKSKLYTSFSQSASVKRMVQSLLPIWEEEFERTGMHESIDLVEGDRPTPETTLACFLNGVEYTIALQMLCEEAEFCSPKAGISFSEEKHTPPLNKLINMDTVGSSSDLLACVAHRSNTELIDFPEGDNEKTLMSRSAEAAVSYERQVDPSSSDTDRVEHSKITDVEALRLLSWLSSSQAVGDISSDDELGCEAIMSPVLLSQSFSKVLEKAHKDRENASQKECQDILDTLAEMKFETAKEKVSSVDNDDSYAPSDVSIPQVDGSLDDFLTETKTVRFKEKASSSIENNATFDGADVVIPQVDGSSDDPGKYLFNKVSENNTCHETEKATILKKEKSSAWRPGSMRARKKPLWGMLPFSNNQEQEGSVSSSINILNVNDSDETRGDCTSSLVCCEDTANLNVNSPNTASEPTRNSLRDLMRRKHAQLQVHDVVKDHGTVGHFLEGDEEVTKFLRLPCPKSLQGVHHVLDSENTAALHIPGLTKGKARLDDSTSKFCIQTNLRTSELNSLSTSEFLLHSGDSESVEDRTVVRAQELEPHLLESPRNIPRTISGCDQQLTDIALTPAILPISCANLPDAAHNSADLKGGKCTISHPEYREMAFYMKPPAIDRMDEQPEEMKFAVSKTSEGRYEGNPMNFLQDCRQTACSSVAIHASWRQSLYPTANSLQLSSYTCFLETEFIPDASNKFLEDLQPFFLERFDGVESFSNLDCSEDAPDMPREYVMGIPTHFQNDGSFLYMLTYAMSPPSLASVRQWILDASERDNIHLPSLERTQWGDGDLIGNNPGNDHEGSETVPSQLQNLTEDIFDSKTNPQVSYVGSLYELPSSIRGLDDLKQPSDIVRDNCDKIDASMTGNVLYMTSTQSQEPPNAFGIERRRAEICWHDVSQLSGPDQRSKLTPLSQLGFRDPASEGCGQQLTLLSMEVQTEVRGELRPDPHFDAVNIVTLVIQEDSNAESEVIVLLRTCDEHHERNLYGLSDCNFVICSEEKCLFERLTKIICSIDPDIVMGWEIQGSSLGYLGERATRLGVHFLKSISRTPLLGNNFAIKVPVVTEGLDSMPPGGSTSGCAVSADFLIEDEWGRTHASGIHVGGRIVLNLWRLLQSEVKLNLYTVEAVAEEVLRRKIPLIPYRVLNHWFSDSRQRPRFRCIQYSIEKTKLNLAIVNKLDMINRTSELARVFGIDFFSVLSRGSQFRVESMMLRLAHSQNYLAISPGYQQVALQPAMECLPLVMEPVSGFYADPVVVLDFQSLYPSMIIAYNLCYCTCLGKAFPSKENILGVSSYAPERQLFAELKNQILLCPNGVMYVSSKIRQGVLPRLLEEILSTRIMVKKAMKKLEPSQQVLHRIYNARQLALKLIANVTYGYTAAGFSGRMPCAELADSIVQCGRRTLESAISYVNSEKRWNASVVYGDTDSMFVLLKGRSLAEAFGIGNEIASAITAINPCPVTLKLEKVYYPCFLLTKKRYVGYSFESPSQHRPKFDAKGIETVRRDTCCAVAKTLEQSLRIFFEGQSISKVKSYIQRQWTRILSGKVTVQDFVFAKEVRLGTYHSSATLPPAAIVATKAMQADPRAEPLYAERIPYVVVHGEPGSRLVDMVVDPLHLLDIDSPYRLNDIYYITKQIIPALQRVFGLLGSDLKHWFSEIPRPARPTLSRCQSHSSIHDNSSRIDPKKIKRRRIDSYYLSKRCSICSDMIQSSDYLCDNCSKKGPVVAAVITGKTSKLERDMQHLAAICGHCGGADWMVESGVKCNSLACSVFYERRKVQKELRSVSTVANEAGFYPRCSVEWF